MDAPAKINATTPAAAGFEKFLVDNGFVAGPKITQIHALQQQTGQDFGQLLLAKKSWKRKIWPRPRPLFLISRILIYGRSQVPAFGFVFNPGGIGEFL